MNFEDFVKSLPEYNTLVFQHGERLFMKRDGDYEILSIRLAHSAYAVKQEKDQSFLDLGFVELRKEHAELIAFNTDLDRKQKSAEKVAEKYKRKVLMIADLLRNPTDSDMTLRAIKTVVAQVGDQ